MKYQKVIIISIFFLALLSFSAISAAENMTGEDSGDIISSDNAQNGEVGVSQDNALNASAGTFTNLADEIENSNGNLILNRNYVYSSGDSIFETGIVINKKITIDGNGFYISGNKQARALFVNSSDVIIKNVIFKDCKRDWHDEFGGYGSAIYYRVTANVENCTFMDNVGEMGGALFFNAENSWAVNCRFVNNEANSGGAISRGSAINCIFTGNKASIGGAMHYSGSAINCTFNNNYASLSGGASYYVSAENCSFYDNSARYGGAIYGASADNCNFTGNHATEYGGAMYEGTVYNCIFKNNHADTSGDDTYDTKFPKAVLSVSDFNSYYNSGAILNVGLSNENGALINNANITVRVYKNKTLMGTYYFMSSNGWTVNLNAGNYEAVFSVENMPYSVDCVNATLTISKDSTIISAPSISTAYADDKYLVVTLKDSRGRAISGASISVDLNGVKTLTTDKNGQVKVSTKTLPVNEYTATVSFTGNDNYVGCSVSTKVTVNSKDSSLVVGNVVFDYGSSGSASLSFTGASGVKASVVGHSEAVVDVKGNVITVSGLNAGSYVLSVTTVPYSGYNAVTKNATVTVNKQATVLSAPSVTAIENEDKYLVVSLKDSNGKAISGVSVSVNLNGVKTLTTDGNGQVRVSTKSLAPNTYTVAVSFTGNGNYRDSSVSTKVTVNSKDSSLVVGNVVFDYGSSGSASLSFTGASGVKASVVGHSEAVVDVKGNVITVSGLNAGSYVLSVTTVPYSGYNAVTKNATVTVNKQATVLSAPSVTAIENEDKYLVVSLKDSNGKAISGVSVSVNLNGVKTLTTDGNGQVRVSTKSLAPNTYTSTVSFTGNGNYNPSSASAKVTINKKDSGLIINGIIVYDYGSSGSTTVLFTESSGVKASVVGHSEAVVDVKGNVITVSGLNAGSYTLSVSTVPYSGYNSVTKTATITVNKDSTKLSASSLTATYGENKYLVVTLMDSNGKAINGADLSVNLNGVKNYKTNNGQIKVPINALAPSSYTTSITFAGNGNYNKVSATAKVTVKKATPKLTAGVKSFKKSVTTKKYTVTLKNNQNKVMKSTKVSLTVNGKTYYATTNSKGQATFKITKLTKTRTFQAKIRYAGDKYYNSKTVSTKIIVK